MRMEAKQELLSEEELFSTFELVRKLSPEHELLRLGPLGLNQAYNL